MIFEENCGMNGPATANGCILEVAHDRRNHRQPAAQFVGHDAGDLDALGRRQRKHFAGVAVGHHGDHAVVARQPAGQAAQGGFVDAVVGGERAGDRGDDAAVIRDRRHGCFPGPVGGGMAAMIAASPLGRPILELHRIIYAALQPSWDLETDLWT